MRAVEYLKILIRMVYLSTLRCILRYRLTLDEGGKERRPLRRFQRRRVTQNSSAFHGKKKQKERKRERDATMSGGFAAELQIRRIDVCPESSWPERGTRNHGNRRDSFFFPSQRASQFTWKWYCYLVFSRQFIYLFIYPRGHASGCTRRRRGRRLSAIIYLCISALTARYHGSFYHGYIMSLPVNG